MHDFPIRSKLYLKTNLVDRNSLSKACNLAWEGNQDFPDWKRKIPTSSWWFPSTHLKNMLLNLEIFLN